MLNVFKPRAPKPIPEGAKLYFHFPQDAHAAAERERMAHGMPVDMAITRLQVEIKRLRDMIQAASGLPGIKVLTRQAERLEAEQRPTEVERSQMSIRLYAGMCSASEYDAVASRLARITNDLAQTNSDIQKREAAADAQAALARILEAVT